MVSIKYNLSIDKLSKSIDNNWVLILCNWSFISELREILEYSIKVSVNIFKPSIFGINKLKSQFLLACIIL